MWHHNKKNPMISTPAKAPAKPAPVNSTAQSSSSSSIKMGSPEIRIGLDGASRRSGMGEDKFPKMPKDKKVAMPKPKKSRMPKVKIPKMN